MELRGEDLSCHSDVNWIVLVSENVFMVFNLPTKHIGNITVTTIYRRFAYRMAARKIYGSNFIEQHSEETVMF